MSGRLLLFLRLPAVGQEVLSPFVQVSKGSRYDWPNHKFNCEDPAWRPDNQDLAEARRVAVGQQQLEKYKRRHKKRKRDVEIVETTGETRQEWNLRVEKKMFVECGLFSDKAWGTFLPVRSSIKTRRGAAF